MQFSDPDYYSDHDNYYRCSVKGCTERPTQVIVRKHTDHDFALPCCDNPEHIGICSEYLDDVIYYLDSVQEYNLGVTIH